MKKPVYLRQATWDWLLETTKNSPETEVREARDRPGAWLLKHGLLDRADILKNTVIEQNPIDGPDCLIDELAAVSLSLGLPEVTLFRLGDQKPVVMTREEITISLQSGETFDQMERDEIEE